MDNNTIIKLKRILLSFLRPQLNREKNKLLRNLRTNKKVNVVAILALIALLAFDNLSSGKGRSKAKDEPFPKQAAYVSCDLKKVIDGDTVEAYCGGRTLRIRMIGIDAPEMGQKPWGQQSKENLEKLLTQKFSLESHGKDVYNRQLGKLYYGNQDLNLMMINQGWAVAYDGKDTPKNYKDAQQIAKSKKIGIWAKNGLHQDPKKWRRQKNS